MTEVIAHITDTHLGQKLLSGEMGYKADPEEHKDNLIRILGELRKRSVNNIIFGGDIGTSATHKWFFDLIGERGFNLRLVLGNHDRWPQICLHYQPPSPAGLAELAYTDQDAFVKYIYMDSSANKIGAAQLSWLKRELVTDKKVLLFVHHPVLRIDTPLDASGGALDAAGAALRDREQIADALRASQNEITLFCGHYHMDDETADGNIRQYLTPAASYLIEKAAKSIAAGKRTFGYRLIKIEGADISTEAIFLKK